LAGTSTTKRDKATKDKMRSVPEEEQQFSLIFWCGND
jgi:hypothetical protein